jgi:hypothetical protein
MSSDNYWPKLIGKVMVSAAVQATFGNLELPSRMIMRTLITTQEDADAFIDAVHGYMIIGTTWLLGTTALMYDMHEYFGAILNLAFQIAAMTWIISRRYAVYIDNVRKYNLTIKPIF